MPTRTEAIARHSMSVKIRVQTGKMVRLRGLRMRKWVVLNLLFVVSLVSLVKWLKRYR